MQFPKAITDLISQLSTFLIGQLRAWTKPVTENMLAQTVADVSRSRQALLLENALLRQQLIVLKRQVKRPKRLRQISERAWKGDAHWVC